MAEGTLEHSITFSGMATLSFLLLSWGLLAVEVEWTVAVVEMAVGEGDVRHRLRREEDGGAGMISKGGGGTDKTWGVGGGRKIKGGEGQGWQWGASCLALLGETLMRQQQANIKLIRAKLTLIFVILLYLWAGALYSAVAWILTGSKLEKWKACKERCGNRVPCQLTLFFSVVLYGTGISLQSCECISTLVGFAWTHSRSKGMILEIQGFVGRLVEMGCRVGRGTTGGFSV